MKDYYLKAESEQALWEALENAGIAKNIALPYPLEVADPELEKVLDQLPLDDAELSQTVEYEGETYMADAGKWFKLMPRYLQPGDDYSNIGNDFQIAQGVALDIIGTIYKPTGVMLTDEEGNEFPETAPIPGFHANLRLIEDKDVTTLEPWIIEVNTPTRVWA